MKEDLNWNLIHRYLSGESTPDESKKMQAWIEEDPSHREFIEAVEQIWEITPEHDVKVDFEEEWDRINQRLGVESGEQGSTRKSKETGYYNLVDSKVSKGNRYTPAQFFVRVAAIILIIAGPVFYFINYSTELSGDSAGPSKSEIAMKKVETARGERASVEFSDETTVLLNSKSTIRFPRAFSNSQREVFLEGEAFFNVEHKENDIPFFVNTGETTVRVLGTEFNVRAYSDNDAVEVVVKQGRVAVRQDNVKDINKDSGHSPNDRKAASEVILTDGQRTVVEKGELPTTPQKVTLAPYLGWVEGQMVFEGATLREILQRLRKTYDFNFAVTDSTLLSKRLTASYRRESPGKISELIAFSLGINYELHDSTVIFKPNEKRSAQ